MTKLLNVHENVFYLNHYYHYFVVHKEQKYLISVMIWFEWSIDWDIKIF